MSKHTHTPGPWTLTGSGHPALSLYGPDGKGLWHESRSVQEVFASVQLCAAAPEMLEALKELLFEYECRTQDWGEETDKARAAIEKAEGRDNG